MYKRYVDVEVYWEKEGKITPLRVFCSQQNEAIPQILDEVKSYNAWNVAQSNPCFEIWLYYHFYNTKPQEEDVSKYASFKEYVNSVISGGFNFEKDPARLEDAIANTNNNFHITQTGTLLLYSSEVYRLGIEIDGFVKKDVSKLRNKIV